MNTNTASPVRSSAKSLKTSAAEWDKVRSAFASSLMVDTRISSLAENLDGSSWPITSADETPASYVDLSFDDAIRSLSFKGLPASRLDQLVAIFSDTLAFDDPFGEMISQSEAAAHGDNPVIKNLAKLGISEDFPLELSSLPGDTLEFCQLEHVTTLGEFALFSQGLARNIVVGGDFRTLLNALSHIDEPVLARYLPFRTGAKGLHLFEAVAHNVRLLPASLRVAYARNPDTIPVYLRIRVTQFVSYFHQEASGLAATIAAGTPLDKLVKVLGDPSIEATVASLLSSHLAPVPVARRGWFSRILSRVAA